MNSMIEKVRARVADQKTRQPELYGGIDFAATPERFTDDRQHDGECCDRTADDAAALEHLGEVH